MALPTRVHGAAPDVGPTSHGGERAIVLTRVGVTQSFPIGAKDPRSNHTSTAAPRVEAENVDVREVRSSEFEIACIGLVDVRIVECMDGVRAARSLNSSAETRLRPN